MDDQDLSQVVTTSGPGDLKTTIEHAGDRVVVTVDGELDAFTELAVCASFMQALGLANQTVVIDLPSVTFFGSKGLQLLLESRRIASDPAP